MAVYQLDADAAESVAGVVRLLRRAAVLVWEQVDAHGPGLPRQVLALGLDLAADEARNLLDHDAIVDGPVPVGDDPAGLLRSAELLLRRIGLAGAPAGLHGLRAPPFYQRPADLTAIDEPYEQLLEAAEVFGDGRRAHPGGCRPRPTTWSARSAR